MQRTVPIQGALGMELIEERWDRGSAPRRSPLGPRASPTARAGCPSRPRARSARPSALSPEKGGGEGLDRIAGRRQIVLKPVLPELGVVPHDIAARPAQGLDQSAAAARRRNRLSPPGSGRAFGAWPRRATRLYSPEERGVLTHRERIPGAHTDKASCAGTRQGSLSRAAAQRAAVVINSRDRGPGVGVGDRPAGDLPEIVDHRSSNA